MLASPPAVISCCNTVDALFFTDATIPSWGFAPASSNNPVNSVLLCFVDFANKSPDVPSASAANNSFTIALHSQF